MLKKNREDENKEQDQEEAREEFEMKKKKEESPGIKFAPFKIKPIKFGAFEVDSDIWKLSKEEAKRLKESNPWKLSPTKKKK